MSPGRHSARSTYQRGHLLHSQHGCETNANYEKTVSLKRGIMRLTDGEGVDLVLNLSVVEVPRDNLDCFKSLGIVIELGKNEMQQGSQPKMAALNRSIIFHGFDLETQPARDPERIYRMLCDIISLFESQLLRAIHPITTYPINHIKGPSAAEARGSTLAKLFCVSSLCPRSSA